MRVVFKLLNMSLRYLFPVLQTQKVVLYISRSLLTEAWGRVRETVLQSLEDFWTVQSKLLRSTNLGHS